MLESNLTSEQGPSVGLNGSAVVPLSRLPVIPSPFRAWLALVALSIRRQARMRQMVWIALGLLALVAGLVAVANANDAWSMNGWRFPRRTGLPYRLLADYYSGISQPLPAAPET